MSKAFTRESDDLPDLPPPTPPRSPLPPGAKNYLTPDGATRLREELQRLAQEDRPRLAATAADPETKRLLNALDQRVRYLEQSLQSAHIVPPPASNDTRVRFGATVSVREASTGQQTTYRIVGVDETDIDRGWVSWLSPIARALLNTVPGQRVRFRFPSGEEELEILSVSYDAGHRG